MEIPLLRKKKQDLRSNWTVPSCSKGKLKRFCLQASQETAAAAIPQVSVEVGRMAPSSRVMRGKALGSMWTPCTEVLPLTSGIAWDNFSRSLGKQAFGEGHSMKHEEQVWFTKGLSSPLQPSSSPHGCKAQVSMHCQNTWTTFEAQTGLSIQMACCRAGHTPKFTMNQEQGGHSNAEQTWVQAPLCLACIYLSVTEAENMCLVQNPCKTLKQESRKKTPCLSSTVVHVTTKSLLMAKEKNIFKILY